MYIFNIILILHHNYLCAIYLHTEQPVTYLDYFIKTKRDNLTILSGAIIFALYHRVVKSREKLRLIHKDSIRSGGGGGGGS